jgi:amino acid transporter
MVFTVLSFAGFEGAATLGEETVHPRRNIPIAMFGTVVGAGVFFVFVAYCEILGYGPGGIPGGIAALAKADAPLNELALRYGSQNLATLLDLATATSAFSGLLGGLAAAARVLFALGRVGLAPRLGFVHTVHGTPAVAVTWSTLLILAPFLVWAPFSGAGNYYSYLSTIATLALILIYVAVGGAEMIESWRERRRLMPALCALGPLVLLWALYRTLYPAPEFPNNLWPYVAFAWALAALGVMRLRPAVRQAPLPDPL